MSDTDSFIDEVSEEVRRDRFFRYLKRYGWIAIALVVLLVGGAAYNEWQKASKRSAAESLGDQLLLALQNDDPAARLSGLEKIDAGGDVAAMVAMLTSAAAVSDESLDTAAQLLRGVAADGSVSDAYRHLAVLKLLLIEADDLSPQDRIEKLQPLIAAGAPYRLVAEEQIAMAEIDLGDSDAAIKRMQDILADGEVTPGLRRRVSQLIVALGGELESV